ncbi:MAG: D-alanine--D-alanine ligase [Flavobacteriales bacterium]|nr:D-alanine--D-alanine ligase [Flavobacteriales bacterium]
MSTKKIAVVAGGFSGEAAVSLRSAQMIMDHIDRTVFEPMLITIDTKGWHAHTPQGVVEVDKSDFSIPGAQGKWQCDKAFIIVHGTPGENGILQGYFELLGIPHTTGDVFNMALTFNKSATNQVLNAHGFASARNIMLRKDDHYSTSDIVSRLGLPLFVKPNQGGSSLCTSRVNAKEALHAAINMALQADDEVIIENFISGRELTCGVIVQQGVPMALPVTEIISENEFFDYQAKYEGKSSEITPAQIDDALTAKIQALAERIFRLLDCRGMIRVDFLVPDGGEPHVIEVNTVPGFSAASIIPQQAAAIGMSKTQLITAVLNDER